MILKDFLPIPVLREFVQCYRIVHFEFDQTTPLPVKAYPPIPEECLNFYLRGCEQVQFNKGSKINNRYRVALVGLQTSVINRYVERTFLDFQIVFQPTALFKLTGISSFEFTNKYLDAETIFSKNIRFVYDELQHAKNYSEMLVIADRFVTSIANKSKIETHRLDKVGLIMVQHGGNISLDWLAKESCLCKKQFQRKFNERVGINPKTYAKIIRFTKAFDTKNTFPTRNWFSIAIDCGYYDYQHLVKDYLTFTGLTPNKLHFLESNSPESVLGLQSEFYRIQLHS